MSGAPTQSVPARLRDVPADTYRKVVRKSVRREFGRGEFVFARGWEAEELWIIDTGQFSVEQTGEERLKTIVFTILGPGETFGEVALLDERATRSASVRAITPGVARYIKREDFYDIREEDPTVDRFLIAVLTAQVRRLSQRAYEASRVSAPQRVRRRLLSLAETFGGHDGVEIEVTHQVLADLAGTSRALANKVVGEETRKRVLDGGYGTIRVLNIAALAERAQPEK